MNIDIAVNPYIGPRPFTTSDRGNFFGRDREADSLIPMVIAERLVLFYAQSGAGKSSLIHARLLPGLVERNFFLLPVGRVSGERAPGLPVGNIFIYNLLTRLDQGKTAPEILACLTLSEYLSGLEFSPHLISQADDQPFDTPQVVDGVQPIALIIDQFEEIFTNHPESWTHRKGFFEQLNQAMQADPYLWVVLVMREDYVAEIEPYAYLLPGRLRARFYMQRMGHQAALQAVQKPVEKLRPFEAGVAEKLVANLRMIAVSDEDGTTQYVEDEFVEPVQLQVVCHQLWQNLAEKPGPTISDAHLAGLAKEGDLAHFINRALSDFYEQALAAVLHESGDIISERQLREWFAKQLITEAETRGSAFMGDRTTAGLPNPVVFLLEARFILRSETRAAGKWYELSHDRFIGPILKSNREWQERNPLAVLADAEAWQAAGRSPQKLYEGRRLADALEQLHRRPDDFSPLEQAFLHESERVAVRARTARQHLTVTVLTIISLVLIGLSIFSYLQADRATKQSIIANTQQALAESASTLAFDNKSTAEAESIRAVVNLYAAETQEALAVANAALASTQQANAEAQKEAADFERGLAQTAQVDAENQKSTAVAALNEAQQQREKAEAGQISSLANYMEGVSTNLSMLYAIVALNRFDSWESRGTLFDLIQQNLDNPIEQIGLPLLADGYARQAVLSPDGQIIAAGLEQGLGIWTVKGYQPILNFENQQEGSKFAVNSVAFDSTNTYLARGGNDGKVVIWNIDTRKTLWNFFPEAGATINFPVTSIAFQPDGPLLAVATDKGDQGTTGKVYLFDYANKKLVSSRDCRGQRCSKVVWSPDGALLAVGTDWDGKAGGDVTVYDPANMDLVFERRQAHLGPVRALAWYPKGGRLASAGADLRISVWDVRSGGLYKQSDPVVTPQQIYTIAVSPDGKYLLTNDSTLTRVSIWDADTLKLNKEYLSFGSGEITSIAFNQQGNRLITAARDKSIALWKYGADESFSKPLHDGDTFSIFGVQVRTDGQPLLARVQASGAINVFPAGEKVTDQLVSQSKGAAFASINGSPVMVVANANGQFDFLDPQSGAPVRNSIDTGANQISKLAVGAQGQILAAVQCTGNRSCSQLAIWDLTTQQPLAIPAISQEFGEIVNLAVDDQTRSIAVGTQSAGIFVVYLDTSRTQQIVTNQSLTPTSLAFAPEDDLLAVGFGNGLIGLWQPSTARPVGEFVERAGGIVTGLAFHQAQPGGDWSLLSVTDRGEVRSWVVDKDLWIAQACKMLNDTLSEEEVARFYASDVGEIPCQ